MIFFNIFFFLSTFQKPNIILVMNPRRGDGEIELLTPKKNLNFGKKSF